MSIPNAKPLRKKPGSLSTSESSRLRWRFINVPALYAIRSVRMFRIWDSTRLDAKAKEGSKERKTRETWSLIRLKRVSFLLLKIRIKPGSIGCIWRWKYCHYDRIQLSISTISFKPFKSLNIIDFMLYSNNRNKKYLFYRVVSTKLRVRSRYTSFSPCHIILLNF